MYLNSAVCPKQNKNPETSLTDSRILFVFPLTVVCRPSTISYFTAAAYLFATSAQLMTLKKAVR